MSSKDKKNSKLEITNSLRKPPSIDCLKAGMLACLQDQAPDKMKSLIMKSIPL